MCKKKGIEKLTPRSYRDSPLFCRSDHFEDDEDDDENDSDNQRRDVQLLRRGGVRLSRRSISDGVRAVSLRTKKTFFPHFTFAQTLLHSEKTVAHSHTLKNELF